jgi:hypothetical protein
MAQVMPFKTRPRGKAGVTVQEVIAAYGLAHLSVSVVFSLNVYVYEYEIFSVRDTVSESEEKLSDMDTESEKEKPKLRLLVVSSTSVHEVAAMLSPTFL